MSTVKFKSFFESAHITTERRVLVLDGDVIYEIKIFVSQPREDDDDSDIITIEITIPDCNSNLWVGSFDFEPHELSPNNRYKNIFLESSVQVETKKLFKSSLLVSGIQEFNDSRGVVSYAVEGTVVTIYEKHLECRYSIAFDSERGGEYTSPWLWVKFELESGRMLEGTIDPNDFEAWYYQIPIWTLLKAYVLGNSPVFIMKEKGNSVQNTVTLIEGI